MFVVLWQSTLIHSLVINAHFFWEVALAIYLIRYNITNLLADGHKQYASHKANCDVHNALMCFKYYPEHIVSQVFSNPSSTRQSYHNNTPQKGSNRFVAIRMSSMDFGFQIILWKHHLVQQNIANIIIQTLFHSTFI